MSIFVFSDISKSEEAIQRTWDEFRSALAAGVFSYSELDTAKAKTTFLKVFDDLFSNCHQFFDASIESILSPSRTLVRAGRLRPEDPEPTYSRFIPNKDFITKHNRFSPPGVEWLYLAVGDLDNAQTCALKECRALEGEKYGLCQFTLNKDYSGRILVDLTIANDALYKDLNDQLEKDAVEIRNREAERAVISILRKGYAIAPDISDSIVKFKRWFAYTYARLLSKQIFAPVETEDKELIYSPFQCMAQYFLSLGYEGIVYSSTVFPKGKNVVLFDKDAACPIGEIKIVM